MQVGDLVKSRIRGDFGIVVAIERIDGTEALINVMFGDKAEWFYTEYLEVVSCK